MSIRDEIKARMEEGRLVVVKPLMPGSAHSRVILATPDLLEEINGPWEDPSVEYRMGRLRSDLDRFSTGRTITVSSGRENTAFMKQLDPPDDEIWEIRSTDPKPSLRLFGRFPITDVFFATNLSDRASLEGEGSRKWRDQIVRCKTEWSHLFPTYEPVSGEDIHDYVSSNVVDLRRFG